MSPRSHKFPVFLSRVRIAKALFGTDERGRSTVGPADVALLIAYDMAREMRSGHINTTLRVLTYQVPCLRRR